MPREIHVELRITGLAIVDTETKLIHFLDTSSCKAEHRHYPRITFRPDDWVGRRYPDQGSTELFRPGISADFEASFPLAGEVTVGTRDEIRKRRTTPPTIGAPSPRDGLFHLDEIVKIRQLGYDRLAGDYPSKAVATIRLVGGELYAGKRIVNEQGEEQRFEVAAGAVYLCDHVIWKRALDEPLGVRQGEVEEKQLESFSLGRQGLLRFSMTNLPTHGRLSKTPGPYFGHLEKLGSLGVAEGRFVPPTPVEPGVSPGSESCSPAGGP
jgi:hypothetical protein